MEKKYFSYIRVSTARQGEKGVSLQEQKDAIIQYAQRYSLNIAEWFEERESAAKRGRPVFTQMMKQLRRGKACGVIIHKIDRSARNLKDWADLGELIDAGLEVHFANESLDLNTRGGRLSADIQAVVAADYIRNLREESRKGFYGRLKQGLYPLPAPIGYIDRGKGQEKQVDPERGPIVVKLFALYGTGKYPLHRLLDEAQSLGLHTRQGKLLSLNGLSTVLNNPFYTGMIRIRRTGELFPGNHAPLIAKSLFDRVQAILRGKTVTRMVRHEFAFRKLLKCGPCGYTLIGERQKGHVYYRCQQRFCPTTTIREEAVDMALAPFIAKLILEPKEVEYAEGWLENMKRSEQTRCQQELHNSRLQLDSIRTRLGRLTDAFIEGIIDKSLFEGRKAALLGDEQRTMELIHGLEAGNGTGLQRLQGFLELVRIAPVVYVNAEPEEKRDLTKKLFSNLKLIDKKLEVTPKPGLHLLVNREKSLDGRPYRGIHRTWNRVLKKLLAQCQEEVLRAEAVA